MTVVPRLPVTILCALTGELMTFVPELSMVNTFKAVPCPTWPVKVMFPAPACRLKLWPYEDIPSKVLENTTG